MNQRRDLLRYPRPSVAVDLAVLTVVLGPRLGEPGSIAVLLIETGAGSTGRALPGRFLREGQTVALAVADVLRLKVGLTDVRARPRLLRVFDEPDRDPRGWTISLAHSLTLNRRPLEHARGELVEVTAAGRLRTGEALLFDHDVIVMEAAAAMRGRYEQQPDPDDLLEDSFTMAQLRRVHEAVLGEPLLKDTFRRRMEPHLRVQTEADGTPVLKSNGGRPAQVYVRRGDPESLSGARPRPLLPRSPR